MRLKEPMIPIRHNDQAGTTQDHASLDEHLSWHEGSLTDPWPLGGDSVPLKASWDQPRFCSIDWEPR